MRQVTENKPGLLKSIFGMHCPRCRKGKLFANYSSYNFKHMLHMHEQCAECGLEFNMEPGFWYGTGYVSYALAIAFSCITLVSWYLFIGFGLHDNRFFWWMCINAGLLIALQPWIMRISRTIYLYFFVRYDRNYKNKLQRDYHENKKFFSHHINDVGSKN